MTAARALVSGGFFDAAVGVAYFAGYHAAVAIVMVAGGAPNETGIWRHRWLHRRFEEVSESHELNNRLRALYQSRLNATYTVGLVRSRDTEGPLADAEALCILARSRLRM